MGTRDDNAAVDPSRTDASPDAAPTGDASRERVRRIDEISAESRNRILDAAEELFATKGFERTSFVDIARLSGISRGSIPWHFTNKDGLLLAVIERSVKRSLREANLTPDAPFRDLMKTLAGTAANPQLMFMLMTEALEAPGAVHSQYVDYYRTHRERLREYMAHSHPGGLDGDDEKRQVLATVISAAMTGLQFLAALDPEQVDVEQGAEMLSELVYQAVGWR